MESQYEDYPCRSVIFKVTADADDGKSVSLRLSFHDVGVRMQPQRQGSRHGLLRRSVDQLHEI